MFDLGAFHCEWSLKISEMYNNPKIYAFEATPSIYQIGLEAIKNNPNIKLYDYGVGKYNSTAKINMGPAQGVSTSLYIKTDSQVDVKIRSIKEVFDELKIQSIDLMKINIEGSEYDVLECLIDAGLQHKVKNFQVQFHRLGRNYEDRYGRIKKYLSKSHKTTYSFPYIWENWLLCR